MLVSLENSPAVQLMDTAEAPLLTAIVTPLTRSLKLLLGVSTRTIVAFGAIACAHSTSNEISTAQLAFAAGYFAIRINFAEAAIAAGAGRQTKLRVEYAEVSFRFGIVVRVHDSDRLTRRLGCLPGRNRRRGESARAKRGGRQDRRARSLPLAGPA